MRESLIVRFCRSQVRLTEDRKQILFFALLLLSGAEDHLLHLQILFPYR